MNFDKKTRSKRRDIQRIGRESLQILNILDVYLYIKIC